MKQKGDKGKVEGAKAEPPNMVAAVDPGEEVVAVAEPWLKVKTNESLLLPKRRLVKRMMFDRIRHFIAFLFGVQGSPSSAEAPVPEKATGCFKRT